MHTGQTLRIPGAGTARSPRSRHAADNTSFAEPPSTPIAPKPGAPIAAAAKPFKAGPSVADCGTGETHTVASGETLFSLGRKYGVSPYAIADANGLPHNAQLTLGQKVQDPGRRRGRARRRRQQGPPRPRPPPRERRPRATGEEGTGPVRAAAQSAAAPEPMPGSDQSAQATATPPAARASRSPKVRRSPVLPACAGRCAARSSRASVPRPTA